MMDQVAAFIDFLHRNGLGPLSARDIVADDRRRRFDIAGERRGSNNGSYRLAVEGDMAFGWARSHRESRTVKYFSGKKEELSGAQRAALAAQYQERRQETADARAADQEKVAVLAAQMWRTAAQGLDSHEYATRKNIDLQGVRIKKDSGEILVPLYDTDGKLWNLQKIDRKGVKRFLPAGRITGLYHPVGRKVYMKAKPYIFCEGWATGKTLWKALGCPVFCAMNAGNLLPVARAVRRKYIYAQFVFAADNDQWTMNGQVRARDYPDLDPSSIPGDDPRWEDWRARGLLVNAGVEKAAEAAKAVNGFVVPAGISRRAPEKLTDFNDLEKAVGGTALIKAFFAAYL